MGSTNRRGSTWQRCALGGNDPRWRAAVLNKLREPDEPSTKCCHVVTLSSLPAATLERRSNAMMAMFDDESGRRLESRPRRPPPDGLRPPSGSNLAAEVRSVPRLRSPEAEGPTEHDRLWVSASRGAATPRRARTTRPWPPTSGRWPRMADAGPWQPSTWFRGGDGPKLVGVGAERQAIPQARVAGGSWRTGREGWPTRPAPVTPARGRPGRGRAQDAHSREREVAASVGGGLEQRRGCRSSLHLVMDRRYMVAHPHRTGMSSRAEGGRGGATASHRQQTGPGVTWRPQVASLPMTEFDEQGAQSPHRQATSRPLLGFLEQRYVSWGGSPTAGTGRAEGDVGALGLDPRHDALSKAAVEDYCLPRRFTARPGTAWESVDLEANLD